MSVKFILFDLDGTLLPMDQELFLKTYFGKMAKKMEPYGYDPNELIANVWKGAKAMIKNDGRGTNEEVFWETFTGVYGERAERDKHVFDEFYQNDFDSVKECCGFNPEAAPTVRAIRNMGFKVILATNPIIPGVATRFRMGWAGLKPEDFDYYTTYENSHFAKPNPAYYMEILEKIGAKPEECLMVGNDVEEDMMTEALGMKVFLMDECLLNIKNKDISIYPKGGFKELIEFIKKTCL